MFGYIRPLQGELKIREYLLYRSVYCGLCESLGKCVGRCAKMALSYDFVFYAMLRSSVLGEVPTVTEKRCLLHPIKKRGFADFPALTYTAHSLVTTAAAKCEDDVADREFGAKMLLCPVARSLRSKAVKNGGETIASLREAVDASCSALREAEKRSPSPDEAAEYSGEMTAALFECGLDGMSARIMREVGRHVGRWVYYIDAIDDYESDKKHGRFNPFLREGEDFDRERVRTSLLLELDAAAKAVELIDFPDKGIEAVTKNILYLGMPQTADNVINGKKITNYELK